MTLLHTAQAAARCHPCSQALGWVWRGNVFDAAHTAGLCRSWELWGWGTIVLIANRKQACALSTQDVTWSLKVTGWINNPEKYLRRAVKACSFSRASQTHRRARGPRPLCLPTASSNTDQKIKKNQGRERKIFLVKTSLILILNKLFSQLPCSPLQQLWAPFTTSWFF